MSDSQFWRQAVNRQYLAAIMAVAVLGTVSLAVARTAPPPAQSLRGEASIIDGDTLRIGETTVRLWGVDAPEGGQMCGNDEPWFAARAALTQIVAGREVVCTIKDRDRYKRSVATCRVGEQDLGAAVVRTGWAWDYTRYSKGAYAADELQAARRALGVHSMNCLPPWVWRKGTPR